MVARRNAFSGGGEMSEQMTPGKALDNALSKISEIENKIDAMQAAMITEEKMVQLLQSAFGAHLVDANDGLEERGLRVRLERKPGDKKTVVKDLK
jgi:hypothetical protein